MNKRSSKTRPKNAARLIATSLDREALELLWSTQGHGIEERELTETSVPLGLIRTAPKAFQPRLVGEEHWKIQQHIGALSRIVKQGRVLDPVAVFAIDGTRYIVDGHLRAAAYADAGKGPLFKIPVVHHRGTFAAALLLCVSANTKDKLALTREQKLESAWSLVKWSHSHANCFSKNTIVQETGVADGTVARMRRALAESIDGFDPRFSSWRDTLNRQLAAGDNEFTAIDEDKLITKWADALRKALGHAGDKQYEVAWEAFKRAYPRAAAMASEEIQADMEEGHLKWVGGPPGEQYAF